MLQRFVGTKKYKKRIFLITDGEKSIKTNKNEMESLITQITDNDVRLNVITLDFANEHGEDSEDDDNEEENVEQNKSKYPPESESQLANKDILVNLTERTKGALFPANIAMQIYKQFKKREVMARTKFRGNLDISQDLKLAVQIFSRTREEGFPTLKKYSKVVDDNQSLTAGKVVLDR